jgi:hypothetical protein
VTIRLRWPSVLQDFAQLDAPDLVGMDGPISG